MMLKNRRFLLGLGVLAAFVLAISVNVLAGLFIPGSRLDLTAEKLYTLSDGTRSTLKALDEPVTLRFFFSDRLGREVPVYGAYAQRIRDLLTEYVDIAGGKLKVETYDPQPFSAVEDRAVAYGLQGVPVDQSGEQVYFGLVGTNAIDDEEVVPFFAPERERFLEYDLTKMIAKLARAKQRVVGLISTLPLEGDMVMAQQGGGENWAIVEQLKQFVELRALGIDLASVPDDIDVLMLVHPTGLNERTLYAIDQFVMRGGRLLTMVDPHSEAAQLRSRAMAMQGMPAPAASSDLEKLFGAWGVRLVKDKVIADRRNARRVQVGAGSTTRLQAADYLAWLAIPGTQIDQDDAVTGDLQMLNFASAGILEPVEGATTQFTPLVTSSVVSQQLDAAKVRAQQPDILGILRGFQSEGKSLPIAARITGPAKSAYPDGAPKPAEGEAPKVEGEAPLPAHLAEAKQPISVIVVADTDFLEDRFWAQMQNYFGSRVAVPTANNADLVLNAVENLAGGSAMASLRSRGVSDRPFSLVKDIQQEAEARFRAKEQELQERLKETEKKLADLRGRDASGKTAAQAVLTPEQLKEIDTFRAQMLATRAELREVQLSLRSNIESLQSKVRFINIAAVPMAVAVFAILLGFWSRRRRYATARGTRE
ncbi:Gldg family protein [Lacibacterium aquatile]|uniref:Gldg family protein n=1 Tax=Lacibacterium aquatile TaxID=1168082 RepID=A0ABW5DU52_9PROT